MSDPSKRRFLRMMAAAAVGTAVAPLAACNAIPYGRRWRSAPGPECFANGVSSGFGPLREVLAGNAHQLTRTVVGDLSREPLLRLPEGFSYKALSITGQRMGDGALVPGSHDGMACFAHPSGNHVLVRNHELNAGDDKFGNRAGCLPPNGNVYDTFALSPGEGGGGTTTLLVNRQGELVRDFISLAGTVRNCAGGPTPWGSWISCEETIVTPANVDTVTKKHGYNFEVPALLEGAVDPIPIKGMGRFNHEAVAVDPRTGHVYQTEDQGDSLFYRYVPKTRPERFGDLQQGGALYSLAIDPAVTAKCDGSSLPINGPFVDARRGVRSFIGQPLPVHWLRLDEVDPEEDTLRAEGQLKGATVFARGEGAWYGKGLIYFVSTTGGDDGNGQVWAYDPKRETVTLLVESTDSSALDNPDNICVAPDGTLYLCEDGGGTQYVVGVDGRGNLFPFARNNYNTSEMAGVCFSPDSRFMFFNMQNFGVTFAIFRDDRQPIVLRS